MFQEGTSTMDASTSVINTTTTSSQPAHVENGWHILFPMLSSTNIFSTDRHKVSGVLNKLNFQFAHPDPLDVQIDLYSNGN